MPMGLVNVCRRMLNWVVVVMNETVFRAKKEQFEVDRDEVIKHSSP